MSLGFDKNDYRVTNDKEWLNESGDSDSSDDGSGEPDNESDEWFAFVEACSHTLCRLQERSYLLDECTLFDFIEFVRGHCDGLT